jgi:hypothetical protein
MGVKKKIFFLNTTAPWFSHGFQIIQILDMRFNGVTLAQFSRNYSTVQQKNIFAVKAFALCDMDYGDRGAQWKFAPAVFVRRHVMTNIIYKYLY